MWVEASLSPLSLSSLSSQMGGFCLETQYPHHHCCHLLPKEPEQGYPLDSSWGRSSVNQRGSYHSTKFPTSWSLPMSCGIGRNLFPLLACFYRSSEATWGRGNQHAVTDRCTSKTYRPWHQSPQSWHCHLKSGQHIFVDWSLSPAGIVAPRGPFWRKRRIMT